MDAFSVPIEITTDRKRKFGTLFGTVATVCMFGFICYFIVLACLNPIARKEVIKTPSIRNIQNDTSRYYPFSQGFQVALKSLSFDYDPAYITLDFYRYATENGGANTTWISLNTEPCTLAHFPNQLADQLTAMNITSFMCPSKFEAPLYGDWSSKSMSGFSAEINLCGHLGQTNCKNGTAVKNKYQYTKFKYLYVSSKFDYDNPGSEPIYYIKDMIISIGYYGFSYFTQKLICNEVYQSDTKSYIYESDVKFSNYLFTSSDQFAKVEMEIAKEYDRFTVYNPDNILSSNLIGGQLIQTASSGQSPIIKMFIILCLIAQVGGLYSFIHSLFSIVVVAFNRKVCQTETLNLMKFIKSKLNSPMPGYDPNEFQLNKSRIKVKPVTDINKVESDMRNKEKVKLIHKAYVSIKTNKV